LAELDLLSKVNVLPTVVPKQSDLTL